MNKSLNKTIKCLFIVALVLGVQSVSAYTNKTFLQPRNQGLVNLPLEMTTFQERISAKLENHFGASFEAVCFYGQSTNKSQIGKYFGINNYHTITFQRSLDPVKLQTTNGTFDVGYIIHDSRAAPAPTTDSSFLPTTTISFAPQSMSYGVDLVYYQDLAKFFNGMYLKVNIPVACVQNNPNLCVNGGDITTGAPVASHLATKANIYNFFQGNKIDGQTEVDFQAQLTAGKINGKHSRAGVADIDIMVGYNFLKKETYHAGINIGLSIPAGNGSTGEYFFEPIYGTKHFGLGAGLEASARIWGCEDHNFKINFAANYRYLFQASEKRIPGMTHDNFGQYELLAQTNGLTGQTPIVAIDLTPAANLLNQKVNVTPGSQFDSIIGFAYNKRGFNVDLGYNLYLRESEAIKTRGSTFAASTYGTASKGLIVGTTIPLYKAVGKTAVGNTIQVGSVTGSVYNGNTNFGTDIAQFDTTTSTGVPPVATTWIQDANRNSSAASTPSQFSNAIYVGLGYVVKEWEYPLMFCIGGKYEFAAKNSVLEIWQIHAKIGVSF